MYRKRLVAMFAALLVGLSAGPAAAMTTIDAQTAVEAVQVAPVNDVASDPEVDQEIPGVGRILVDLDPDNSSLTVGVAITPAGIDESVTLGGSGAGSETGDQEAAADQQEVSNDDLATHRDEMDAVKEAAVEKIERTPRPAFAGGTAALSPASGTVAQGSGITASARPTTTASAGNNAAAPFGDPSQNPWIHIMGVVMLAGTSTAWSIAKREGIA